MAILEMLAYVVWVGLAAMMLGGWAYVGRTESKKGRTDDKDDT